MRRAVCLLALFIFVTGNAATVAQEKTTKPLNGVYAVLRSSVAKKDVVPLKNGEMLVVHRHRYMKKERKEPHRFLVVRSTPDVTLDLVGKPTAIKEGKAIVGIRLQLKKNSATALERLTRDRVGRQLAIILGGEVVTTHKIREAIRGGSVQITNCAAGAAKFLFKHLQASQRK